MRWNERLGKRLKLKDLHMLEAIARGSAAWHAAAQDLAISQPAISKAMADLEAFTWACTVIGRVARGVELTEAGRVLA